MDPKISSDSKSFELTATDLYSFRPFEGFIAKYYFRLSEYHQYLNKNAIDPTTDSEAIYEKVDTTSRLFSRDSYCRTV